MANSLVPDFSEADPTQQPGFDWNTLLTGQVDPNLSLRAALNDKVAARRIAIGQGGPADYARTAASAVGQVGNRLVSMADPRNLLNMAISGATAPGDAYSGKLQVIDPQTGQPTDEAIRRSLDLTGLMAGGSFTKAPAEAGVLGSGLMAKAPQLRVAALDNGRVVIGEPGQIHADLPWQNANGTMGFATPDGKFLTREQALNYVKQNESGLAKSPALDYTRDSAGGLHSASYKQAGGADASPQLNAKGDKSTAALIASEPRPEDIAASMDLTPKNKLDMSGYQVKQDEPFGDGSPGWFYVTDATGQKVPGSVTSQTEAAANTYLKSKGFKTAAQAAAAKSGSFVPSFPKPTPFSSTMFHGYTGDPVSEVAKWNGSAYLAFDHDMASDYADSSLSPTAGKVDQYKVNLQNPLSVSSEPQLAYLQKMSGADKASDPWEGEKILNKWAQDQGHDGIVFQPNKNPDDEYDWTGHYNGPQAVVFNPKKSMQLNAKGDKSTAALIASADHPVPPFYSAASRALDQLPLKQAPAEQWSATLKNQPGVKGEELANIQPWLDSRKGTPVTKQELQAHIAQSTPQIKEVIKTDDSPMHQFGTDEEQQAAHDRLERAQVLDATPGTSEWGAAVAEHRAAEAAMRDTVPGWGRAEGSTNNPTKFSEYQLPGGDNYREVLMTLPPKDAALKARFDELTAKKTLTPAEEDEHNLLNQRVNYRNSPDAQPAPYQSSHWDEPNVLAHMRLNDRIIGTKPGTAPELTDAQVVDRVNQMFKNMDASDVANGVKSLNRSFDKLSPAAQADWMRSTRAKTTEDAVGAKTLFAEELQSDWHQAGRKNGYQPAVMPPRPRNFHDFLTEEKGITDPAQIRRTWEDRSSPQGIALHNEHLAEVEDRGAALAKAQQAVPDAPFKKSWPELLLKRMVHEAASKGYDQIAWTDGATQAARYDLSKQVDRIEWDPTTKVLKAFKGGGDVINKKDVTAEQLPDIIGKELADRVVNNPTKKASGEYKIVKDPTNDRNPGFIIAHADAKPGTRGSVIHPGKSVSIDRKGDTFQTKEEAEAFMKRPDFNDFLRKAPVGANILEGVDLKVGGEGMKGFYDDILPKTANKLFGKLGGKVEKQSLKTGLPPFNPDGPENSIAERISEEEHDRWQTEHPTADDEDWDNYQVKIWPKIEQKALIEQYGGGPEGNHIHVLKITPELRQHAISKGFPLFSSSDPIEAGAIASADRPKMTLYHASPNNFDKFDLSKAGARGGDSNSSYSTIEHGLGTYLSESKKGLSNYREAAGSVAYKVGVNHHPDEFLHWDSSLAQQSNHIKQALQKMGYDSEDRTKFGYDVYRGLVGGERATHPSWGNLDQYGIHVPIDKHLSASQQLQDHGVAGIKYNEFVDSGDNSYVVLNPDKLSVLQKKLGKGQWKNATPSSQGNAPPAPSKAPTVDRRFDVPAFAGSSKDSNTVYIDRRVPRSLNIGGKTIDPAKYLTVHETTEHKLMNGGMSYEDAHKQATAAERQTLEADGVDWKSYEAHINGMLRTIEGEKISKPPPDLYLKPYHAHGWGNEAAKLDAAAGHVRHLDARSPATYSSGSIKLTPYDGNPFK